MGIIYEKLCSEIVRKTPNTANIIIMKDEVTE